MSEYNTQSTTYTAGYVTAYGAAKRGGYTGTYEEFCAAIAGMAVTVEDLENFSVVINTLSPGSSATASYANGVLTLGVPQGAKGDKGDKGDTGEVSQAELDEAIGQIKNDLSEFPNGNYSQMGAGYANQLVSGLKKEDSTPYNFRRIPYDATLEEVKKIVGGTVAWNQFTTTKSGSVTPNGTTTYSYTSFTAQNTIIAQHKYFICADFTYNGAKLPMRVYTQVGSANYGSPTQDITVAGTKKCAWIAQFTSSSSTSATLGISNVTTSDKLTVEDAWSFDNAMIVDITKMLGTAIADYVYSLESATAGAGVAWLKEHFPKQFDDYQAYDAGTLKSVSGLTEHRMIGFNQFNKDNAVANERFNASGTASASGTYRSEYIRCVPNTDYYFKNVHGMLIMAGVFWFDAEKNYITHSSVGTADPSSGIAHSPDGAFYVGINFAPENIDTVCINLSDPTKNGTYKPYEAHSYALDSDVVLRGIPKLDSNNRLYYDGDEYLPDGTINRRYGVVDLGTLTYGTLSSGVYYVNLSSQGYVMRGGAVCENYPVVSTVYTDAGDKVITTNPTGVGNAPYIVLKDSSYSDSLAFKTAMSGVYLLYELAAPTTETADPYTTPQIIAPDGTEEYIYEDSAFELPVGHSSDYPIDVSGQLDDILDTPSANGTYVLKATVTDGAVTYSWVADA